MEQLLLIILIASGLVFSFVLVHRIGYQSGYMQHMEDLMQDEIQDEY